MITVEKIAYMDEDQVEDTLRKIYLSKTQPKHLVEACEVRLKRLQMIKDTMATNGDIDDIGDGA